MSSENVKFIVGELGKPPFNKAYNLISFDSLDAIQLLQLLTDMMAEVDAEHKLDIRGEQIDKTAIRILQFLRMLKYKPEGISTHDEMSEYRQNIVQADKHTIHPIMEWLLRHREELAKRAYLGKFLVKIDVPLDIIQDDQVAEAYQQVSPICGVYEVMIESFKVAHKEHQQLLSAGYSTAGMKSDIEQMEDEREQLTRRVERLRQKVEAMPNSAPMLAIASQLRSERETEQKIAAQKQEQRNLLIHCDQRISRLEHQVRQARQVNMGATSESLFDRMEEDVKVSTFLVDDKTPRELGALRKVVQDLQRVMDEPSIGANDLQRLDNQVKTLSAEVNQLTEKKMLRGDPKDDQVAVFKQQAMLVSRKKDNRAEQLSLIKSELQQLTGERDERVERAKAMGAAGAELLRGDDFKKYVGTLRAKNQVHKVKKQQLMDLKTETGTLTRTDQILQTRLDQLKSSLADVEASRGVSGFTATQDRLEHVSSVKAGVDAQKGKTLESMSEKIERLTKIIDEKKARLTPLIEEIRPLRDDNKAISEEYETKKQAYDSTSAGLESNMARLEQDVRTLSNQCNEELSRYHYLNCMLEIVEHKQERVNDEMKLALSNDPEAKKKTLRDHYEKKIREQENLTRTLREQQKAVKEAHSSNMKQMKMWADVQLLLAAKTRPAASAEADQRRDNELEDHLVL